MTISQLEKAAVKAHRCGQTFAQYWEQYQEAIRTVGPRDRFNSLYRKLLCLVVAGDSDGSEPLGDDAPWIADDERTKPSDTATAARWQGMGTPRSGSLEAE